jgi:CheY-like chemotaxis protein
MCVIQRDGKQRGEASPRSQFLSAPERIRRRHVSANSARKALSVLVSEPVDILLTDIGLPDMSGATLAEYATSRTPTLAVIFVTGQALDPATRAGVTAPMLMKPFSLEALLSAIARVQGATKAGEV